MLRSLAPDIVQPGRRVQARSQLRLAAVLNSDAVSVDVVVTDLNTDGYRLETACTAPIDSAVTLVFSSSILIGGRVAWREDGAIGVAFCARLLSRAIAQASRSGSAPPTA